jgi:3-oxoacyl-[acyl-carrier-protein] synthase-3
MNDTFLIWKSPRPIRNRWHQVNHSRPDPRTKLGGKEMKERRGTEKETVGIASIGCYIPSGIITSDEISRLSGIPVEVLLDKIGMERKHIAAEDEHPSEMGIMAAKEAVERAGIDPREIDVLIYCSAGFYDYRIWSPAAKVQSALGADDCYAFDVKNGCNGGNLGINICKSLLLDDPEKRYAMVVCSEKLSISVDYNDKRALSLYMVGDGAAAALLKKGEETNRILTYVSVTEGSTVDSIKVPFGGTRWRHLSRTPDGGLGYIRIDDPTGLDHILSQTYLENYVKVIKSALEKSGRSIKDVDLLLTNQVKRSLLEDILQGLDLGWEDTITSMKDYGHMGTVDALFNLSRAIDSGRIGEGSLVVIASSGAGFTWSAMPMEFL